MTSQQEQSEIEQLAEELHMLAQNGDFELLGQKLPTAEQMADFIQQMFSDPQVMKKFDEQVLQTK